MLLPLVSRAANLSRRFVAVDPVEKLRGFVIEVRLIVGSADDRAISQEGEMPASVFIHLDGIQAGIGGESLPRHLPHEVVAPFVWTQEDFQLAGKDLAVSLNECHIGLSGGWSSSRCVVRPILVLVVISHSCQQT